MTNVSPIPLLFSNSPNTSLDPSGGCEMPEFSAEPQHGVVADPTSCLEQGQTGVVDDAISTQSNSRNLERDMTVSESWGVWRPAAFWCILFSISVIMEGYSNLLLPQFYASPAFCRAFGVVGLNGKYEIPTLWQAGLSIGCLAGEVAGLCMSAVAVERLGYRKTLIISLLTLVVFNNILFFSRNLWMLLIGEILCGIPFGVFQTLSCTYASDVCPMKLRPFLTTYTNMCWLIGQLLSSGVLRILVGSTNQWGYRIPFALQWLCPLPLAIAIFFAPESPWWLVRHGREEDAKKELARLASSRNALSTKMVDNSFAMIVMTNNLEKQLTEGAGFLDCFKNVNARRTAISCTTWIIQNLCGSALMGYSTYFFVQAGLETQMAFNMSLAQYGIGIAGTFFSWYLVDKFGRRTLFGWGLFVLLVALLGMRCAGVVESKLAGWVIVTLLLLFTIVYNSTVGPITYCLVSEISSTRLKDKTVVLARCMCNAAGILNYLIVPYMLNPLALNWGGKSGFFWGAMCFICILWTIFFLPEPWNRSFAELDELFMRKVPAHRFSSTVF